jgi:uncharacterized damage-inducible protein DinB
MTYNSNALLDSLSADVRDIILAAEKLRKLPTDLLTQSPGPGRWSIAQVLAHLNFYSRFYLDAIEKKLHLHQTKPAIAFHPGWLGNYFTNLMKPGAGNSISKKMKSPKNAEPEQQPDAAKELQAFLMHQHHLLNLLQVAKSADLQAMRIPTTLTKLIRLRLGDTFRFLIAHEQRHLVQIENTLSRLQVRHTVAA